MRPSWLLALALMLAAGNAPAACPSHALQEALTELQSATTEEFRESAANTAFTIVDAMSDEDVACVTDAQVDAVAQLLFAARTPTRAFGAQTLGRLGARAARAVPALRQSRFIEEAPVWEIINSSVPLTSFIDQAIENIEAGQRAPSIF